MATGVRMATGPVTITTGPRGMEDRPAMAGHRVDEFSQKDGQKAD